MKCQIQLKSFNGINLSYLFNVGHSSLIKSASTILRLFQLFPYLFPVIQ